MPGGFLEAGGGADDRRLRTEAALYGPPLLLLPHPRGQSGVLQFHRPEFHPAHGDQLVGDDGFLRGFKWRFQNLFQCMSENKPGLDILGKVPAMAGKFVNRHGMEGDTAICKGVVTEQYLRTARRWPTCPAGQRRWTATSFRWWRPRWNCHGGPIDERRREIAWQNGKALVLYGSITGNTALVGRGVSKGL